MNSIINASGMFKLIIKTKNNIEIVKFYNRLLDIYFTELITALNGNTLTLPDVKIKYLAIGDGTTAVQDDDTTLDNELFRCPISDQYTDTNGVLTSEFVITNTDFVGTIEEWGIFAGSSATGTADTGKLIARKLYTYEKLSTQEINIIRTDTISRV